MVVKNRYEGLVSFDSAGEFMGFMGAPKSNPQYLGDNLEGNLNKSPKGKKNKVYSYSFHLY